MIIDPTDFNNRPYKVPNQEESRDFIAFIEETEEWLAIKYLLGKDLWEAFVAGLASSGSVEARWTDLKDGAVYTYNDKTYEYKGWIDMVRPAILSEWIPNLAYKLTNIGYVVNDAPQQSKLLEEQEPFVVTHWNTFVTKVGYQPEFGYNCKDSFYGFMKANESDYEDWIFKCPRYKNRHSL